MENDNEKSLVEKLKSDDSNVVYNALILIKKYYVHNECEMKKLLKFSVIEFIVPLLEHPKYCDISTSIIADCCLKESFVQEVMKWDGITSLMRIMKSRINEEVQNRVCRALGNMAKSEIGCKAVLEMNPVSEIINFLSETKNIYYQQTAVCALMNLGKSPKTVELIVRENGITHITKLLHSSNVDVLICGIKALSNLTKNCSLACAQQFSEIQSLKMIVDLYSHSQITVRNCALIALKNLSMHETLRSGLVKVGALKLFTEVLSKLESYEMSCYAAFALCSCLDHIHMWSHNGTDRAVGLKALLLTLENEKFKSIHLRVISSLIPLSYESKTTEILLNLGILPILIQVLSSFIVKHKCQFRINPSINSNFNSVNDTISYTRSKESDGETAELQFQLSEMYFPMSKKAKENNSNYFTGNSVKTPMVCDNYYNTKLAPSYRSSTSDYSSSSSPNRVSSPIPKLSTSPEVSYDFDVESQSCYSSSGIWSPVSLTNESTLPFGALWSPVVSTESDSVPEKDILLDNFTNNKISHHPSSPVNCSLSSSKAANNNNIAEFGISPPSSCKLLMSCGSNNVRDKPLQKFKRKNDLNIQSDTAEKPKSSKKLKTKNSNDYSKFCSQPSTITGKVIKPGNSSENQLLNTMLLTESTGKQSIDHKIILFILQLYFHLEKKPNSPVADKTCFSVLIDYLCFVHDPSQKVETILVNLIKNRYCFEKLIVNGFIPEIEENITYSNYLCVHRSAANLFFHKLINIGRQEAESDYAVGTIAHILVTSEKSGQLNGICAMSKLITVKSALSRLLFQANGLSLLLNFLSDSCILTRHKAISSLCMIYQSLVKEQEKNKCCFSETCMIKASNSCSYKKSFYNVAFSVNSGVKILANREKLCENSEYFNALLDGHFLETNAKSIFLSDISAENLSTIFHFLHGCGSNTSCPYIKRVPFSVLLELLSDCDRFLLMNIKRFVEDRLCHCLHLSTVPKIYMMSKIHNSPALTKRALDFALSMHIVDKDVLWSCFEELISSGANLNFIGDIESLLKNLF